jgi:hypothetical protein
LLVVIAGSDCNVIKYHAPSAAPPDCKRKTEQAVTGIDQWWAVTKENGPVAAATGPF